MGQFSRLTSVVTSKDTDYTRYCCPYCGQANSMNSSECRACGNPIYEYEAFKFSAWNLFNKALENAKAGNMSSAIENIAVFLSRFPEDRMGNRLRLLILSRTDAQRFDEEANSFIVKSNDRWVATLQDDPESISFDDIRPKDAFVGDAVACDSRNPVEAAIFAETENLKNLIDVINPAFDIHAKNHDKSLRRRGRVFDEYEHFFTSSFARYLSKSGIEIVDYSGKVLDDLGVQQQGLIDHVEQTYKRAAKDGEVVRTIQPEIRFRGLIVQKAWIEVNRKSMKGKK